MEAKVTEPNAEMSMGCCFTISYSWPAADADDTVCTSFFFETTA